MRIRVLGPVEVVGDDGALRPLAPKARQLLTLLAVHAPQVVGIDELADLLWDDAPPAATKTIQAHVSRLRAALGSAADIERRGLGYALRPAPGTCDLDVLATHRAAARRGADGAGAGAGAVAELGAARALWRGRPELPGTVAALGLAARWDQERRSLVDEHLAAVVDGDRPGDVVAELYEATAQSPADEGRWALLVRALHRSGDVAGALRAYQSARRALAGLGLEPGAALRDAEAAALAGPAPPLAGSTRRAAGAGAAAGVVRYADTGAGRVAYTVTGDGPVATVVLLPGLVSIDGIAHLPRLADAVERLAGHGAVACLDRRGIGLSDPVVGDDAPATPSLDHWVDDVVAVLDATGVAPVLFACSDTALVALAVAAAHPDRVRGLVAVHAYARYTRGDGYPFGVDPETAVATSGDVLDVDVDVPDAGDVARFDPLAYVAPSVAGDPDFRRWFDDVGRRAASPSVAAALHRVVLEADVRGLLPTVRVPVLLLHRRSCASADIGHARYLRDHLPHAHLTVLPGADELWFTGDVAPLLHEIERWRTRDVAGG